MTAVRENGHAGLRKNPQRAEEILNEAKLRFVRFLLDLDQYDGAALPEKEVAPRLEAYRKSLAKLHEAEKTLETAPTDENKVILAKAKADAAKFRKAFVEDIKRYTDILKDNLGGFSSDKVKDFDSYKGTVEPEKEKTRFLWRDWPTTKLEWLDWSARWGLLIAGGCMVVGLFTRLACLYCAVFLVIEFLSNPPFPWFPASPKAEGNYTFVNKNVVELMALLALASLPTGRWLGLDALVSRVWPFRRRRRK